MIDLSDGVDCVRFNLWPTTQDNYADYEPCDGSIVVNLHDIWVDVRESEFKNPEGVLIQKIVDIIGHEFDHKWFVWGMGEDFIESFNEQDERVMRCCSDWIFFDKKSKFAEYDWK